MPPIQTLTRRAGIGAAGTLLVAALLHPHTARAQDDAPAAALPSVLYVQSNNPAHGQNSVFGYARAADGSLSPLPGSPFATGGTGFFDPSYRLGPFDSDQNIVVDRKRGVLYTPNGGSNTVAAMAIRANGALLPLAGSPYRIAGSNPLSLALNGVNLIVVNGNENPSQPKPDKHPSLSVARRVGGGRLVALAGTSVQLPDGSAPGQALTTNTGPFVFTNEFFGPTVRSFIQDSLGNLTQLDAVSPPLEAGQSSAGLPLGLWAHPKAPVLYVGLVNLNRLGVYRWNDLGKLTFLRSVPNSGQALCWIRVNQSGSRLYTTNTADQSMSVYDATDPENPVEIQRVVVGGLGGLFTFSLSPDEKFLYVLEEEDNPASANLSNIIHVLAVGADGTLTNLPAASVALPVPPGTRPVGMAVF